MVIKCSRVLVFPQVYVVILMNVNHYMFHGIVAWHTNEQCLYFQLGVEF